MKTFYLDRKVDPTGVSGTGRVAEGVVFANGWVALAWLSQQPSVTVFASIDEVEIVHGHGGSTDIVFDLDRPVNPQQEARLSTIEPRRRGSPVRPNERTSRRVSD